MPKIEPLIHRCRDRETDNKVATEVTRWNYNDECPHCGYILADKDEIMLHMYDELTSEDD